MQRRKPKKFRFQVLHRYIIDHFSPCSVLDIGGGNGLLTYLLTQSGFKATLVDPLVLDLPWKYTDLTKKAHKIPEAEIEVINEKFAEEMAEKADLLVGLHAHGVNMHIIDAAKKFNTSFILVPCCVVDEPIIKQEGIRWTDSLFDYAMSKGLKVQKVTLGFMGKDYALVYNKNTP